MSTTVAERDANVVQDVFTLLLAERFFVNERQMNERIAELSASTQQEAWFSNGVVEFKMVRDSLLGGFVFHNFRRIKHATLDRVEAEFPHALYIR